MTKQEARKQFFCRHCPYRDYETEECVAGDMDSDICPRMTKKRRKDIVEKFKVEPCVSDYAVKDSKNELVVMCNSKRNADLIAAILEKDSHCGDGWNEVGSNYVFTDDDYYNVIGQYSTRTVYGIEEIKLNNGGFCRNLVPGAIVRHFKGNLYEVKDIVKHTETGEIMVVYQALYTDEPKENSEWNAGMRQTFARPMSMFMEEVDRQKYPTSGQQYRMEIVRFKDVRE